VWIAAFSSDGKAIVTASENNTAQVRDTKTGKPVGEPLQGHWGNMRSAAFSSDGARIVTASNDNTVRVWDAQTGKPIGEPLRGHRGAVVVSAAFSSDGKRIITASDDNTARVWDAVTGRQIGEPLPGYDGRSRSVAFSPDGKHVVVAGDTVVRFWEVFANTQELVSHVKAAILRCPCATQRLPPAARAALWCIEQEEWPYNTDVWKQWLRDTRTGNKPSLPAPAKRTRMPRACSPGRHRPCLRGPSTAASARGSRQTTEDFSRSLFWLVTIATGFCRGNWRSEPFVRRQLRTLATPVQMKDQS
jgi:hypothetical protein